MSDRTPQNARVARYRDQVLANIHRYTPQDRDDVLAFRSAMYGSQSVYANAEYLRWLYEEPAQQASNSMAFWLFRKNGRIEGHQGGIHVALKAGSQTHSALWTMDLMVEPHHRFRGIGAVLSEVAFDETGLSLGFEVSEAARKAFLRAGWIDTGTVPLYFRPLDAALVLSSRWRSQLGHIVGRIGNGLLRIVDALAQATLKLTRLEMVEVSAFDEQVDCLWETASSAYPVLCRRDCSYLNWRFAHFPYPDRYRLFYFCRSNSVVGYAVLRIGERHGHTAGYLVDFFCAPRWIYPLLAHCVRFFMHEQVKAVYCLHRSPTAGRAFTLLGFSRRDSGWPLMIRARDLPPAQLALISDQRNWFVTAADSDVDRPRTGTVFASDPSWAEASAAPGRDQPA